MSSSKASFVLVLDLDRGAANEQWSADHRDPTVLYQCRNLETNLTMKVITKILNWTLNLRSLRQRQCHAGPHNSTADRLKVIQGGFLRLRSENNQGMTKISMYDNIHFKLRLSIFKTGDTAQVIKQFFFKMADVPHQNYHQMCHNWENRRWNGSEIQRRTLVSCAFQDRQLAAIQFFKTSWKVIWHIQLDILN